MFHLDDYMKNYEIVACALKWEGTPYQHQAKVKGIGVDCAMLIVGVAEEISDKTINTPVYSPEWHLHNRQELMCEILEQFGCKEKLFESLEVGDILTFKFGRVNSHMGIYLGSNEFIHARVDVKKVVINQLSGEWIERLGRVYKFPETL